MQLLAIPHLKTHTHTQTTKNNYEMKREEHWVTISYHQYLGLEEEFINYKMCGSQLTTIIRSDHSFIIEIYCL